MEVSIRHFQNQEVVIRRVPAYTPTTSLHTTFITYAYMRHLIIGDKLTCLSLIIGGVLPTHGAYFVHTVKFSMKLVDLSIASN